MNQCESTLSETNQENQENLIENCSQEGCCIENQEVSAVDCADATPCKSEADMEEEKEESEAHSHNPHLDGLKKELEQFSDAEAKLNHVIQFMENSLSQNGTPHFRSFWQSRTLCLQLFKEHISPSARATLWTKYSELSKEARRLKELLDEQSAFTVEQIEIAIQGLETDITNHEAKIASDLDGSLEFSLDCHSLHHNAPFYAKTQHNLDILNTFASRINALRKELVKTEMRIRKKNKFFQRLSQAGDRVFPIRKDLIKTVSDKFIEDIQNFVKEYFSSEQSRESLFQLREEIKALQGAAKALTLNTNAFTQTRLRLSECWDKLKVLDKERKQARHQQNEAYKQNVDAVLQKLEEAKLAVQNEELTPNQAHDKIDEVSSFMRTVELGRDEIRYLRDQVQAARQPILDKLKQAEDLRIEQEKERQRLKHQKLTALYEEADALIENSPNLSLELLLKERETLTIKASENSLNKTEKQEIERRLKPLKDIISEKRIQSLMTLSEDDRNTLQNLQEALRQRKELRLEIKNQIEILRKSMGSSGLDFVKAMEVSSQLNSEKEKFEKMNHSIQELEEKISEVENKCSNS